MDWELDSQLKDLDQYFVDSCIQYDVQKKNGWQRMIDWCFSGSESTTSSSSSTTVYTGKEFECICVIVALILFTCYCILIFSSWLLEQLALTCYDGSILCMNVGFKRN